jgi:lysophospholipase L1-like esterase
LAEADGIPVEVRNYGRPAVSMWQELELFQQTIASGQKPDLVVFYDGFNDLAWQMNLELSAEPTNAYAKTGAATNVGANDSGTQNATSTSDSGTSLSDVVDAYWDQSASHHVYDALHDLFAGSGKQKVQFAKGVQQNLPANTPDTELEAARNAISIQSRAATLATAIADSAGAQASFFWQPFIFTKKLLPEEQKYLTLDTYEPSRWDPAVKEARDRLKSTPIVDLGDSLDRATSPVFWDFVHTNEEGARLAAQAIYSRMLPQLQARADAVNRR